MPSRIQESSIQNLLKTDQHHKIALTKARKHDHKVSITCPSCGKDTTIPEYTLYDKHHTDQAKYGITQTPYRIRTISWLRIILLGILSPFIIIPLAASSAMWGWEFLEAIFSGIYLFLGIGLFILIGLIIYLAVAIPCTYSLSRKRKVWQLPCSKCKHPIYVSTSRIVWFNAYVLTPKTG